MKITTIDPSTGLPISEHDAFTDEQVTDALERTTRAAGAWRRRPLAERIDAVRRVGSSLRAASIPLSELISREMGKPVTEAVAEVEKSAATADYYAREGAALLADEPAEVEGADAWVSYEPLGVVLAVMPWNFPVWQVMRFAVPALAAGNGVLLKHSPNVTGCALEIESLLLRAGLPPDLFTTIVVAEHDVPAVTRALIEDDRIAAVTLTGSLRAGSAVGAIAGASVKKSVLELGGSDAFVVLDDADLPTTAAAAVRARFGNCGQSCVSAKRFILDARIAEEFTRLFIEQVEQLVVGDPSDPRTDLGPLAREDLRDQVVSQVERSRSAGATVLSGGSPIRGPGSFHQPTVLGATGPGVAAFDEETFGPVAAIAIADDEAHAATLADQSSFGLGLSIWTGSRQRGVELARHVTTGAAFINAVVASDPRLPFGGSKASGYGRELAAVGMREFVNIRTYWSARP
jgi:acyl-CoA reductase-like NAD-dependent aldehyde dehydrogenase